MKKEVFLAVFVGFVLGLIITFGVWTANRSFGPLAPAVSPTPEVTVTPTAAPTSQFSLSLTSPADEFLSASSTVTITGKTDPQIPVVITSEKGETIVTSDVQGNFTADISLETGYNRLHVEAVNSTGATAAKDLLVTYSTVKI